MRGKPFSGGFGRRVIRRAVHTIARRCATGREARRSVRPAYEAAAMSHAESLVPQANRTAWSVWPRFVAASRRTPGSAAGSDVAAQGTRRSRLRQLRVLGASPVRSGRRRRSATVRSPRRGPVAPSRPRTAPPRRGEPSGPGRPRRRRGPVSTCRRRRGCRCAATVRVTRPRSRPSRPGGSQIPQP